MKKKPSHADKLARRAERMYVNAALMMTRLEPKMREACRLVLADKLTLSQAARKVKDHRQNVYRAVRTVAPKLKEVKDYAAGVTQ